MAIVGRANVGKSSLFNDIIGRREAIVADEPGTTRDKVVAIADYDGKSFWLVDTAGVKDPADDFELTIQEQIREAAASADAIIMVTDVKTAINDEDRRLATLALKTRKPVLLAVSKFDQHKKADLKKWLALGIRPIIGTSATQKNGLDDLLTLVSEVLPKAKHKTGSEKLKLALLGRPNVGKSALFNRLSGHGQALVSAQAGTTRDINRATFEHKGQDIEILDTAGIRRPGKVGRGVEHFSVLRSLAAIEEADICLLLIDATEPSVQLDQKIAGMVKDAGKGLIIVINKWDLAKEEGIDRENLADRVAADFVFANWAPMVFVSALSGQNTDKLAELAVGINERRHSSFKTPELNDWLRKAVNQHPPAGLKGKLPKLNYMVWEEGNLPPQFKIFGAQTKFLHWSYKRYLEHSFRDRWPLEGTPLKFWFIEKKARE